ncbi:hypothetical protein ACFLTK_02920 [Chloroflexota bacterium]
MAKGPVITDRVKQQIAGVYLEHPDWRAKEVQYEVDCLLSGRGPGLSAVQKELTKIRKRDKERSSELRSLDRPWSIGTLMEYDIPPEALPKIVQMQDFGRQTEKPLSIREARWVGRLHTLTTDMKILVGLSLHYALRERVCELTCIPMDTFNIDHIVLKNPLDATGQYMRTL